MDNPFYKSWQAPWVTAMPAPPELQVLALPPIFHPTLS
jgi:hypothetical protein